MKSFKCNYLYNIFSSHSFNFGSLFILVKVTVDPKPIPGNTGHKTGIHLEWDISPSQDSNLNRIRFNFRIFLKMKAQQSKWEHKVSYW